METMFSKAKTSSGHRRDSRCGFLPLMLILCCLFLSYPSAAKAGWFEEGSQWEPYYRVSKDSADLVAWATKVVSINYGSDVDSQWKTPGKALGKATGDLYDIVSLGRGGSIVLSFDKPIKDGPGWDFAVFENGFIDSGTGLTYLELAYIEVSTNGTDFVRFDSISLNTQPMGALSPMDPTNIHGLASKYPCGYGTPFDLSDLADKDKVKSGIVDLNKIWFVRIVDIIGDGTYYDHPPPGWGNSHKIYDPYPTTGSAGFDLEAVGVRYQGNPGVARGDINGDGLVNETDLNIALDVLAGKKPTGIRDNYSSSGADVDGDGKIGMEEVLYILTELSK